MPDSTVKELNSTQVTDPSIKQGAGPDVYFRKGFGLKAEVQADLAQG